VLLTTNAAKRKPDTVIPWFFGGAMLGGAAAGLGSLGFVRAIVDPALRRGDDPKTAFMVAFALLSWFIVAVMARQPQKVALPVAIVGPVIFYLLFDLALDVQLPTGLWF